MECKEARGICGIYKITNDVNGKVYVGQSVNIGKRWNDHIRELENNKHANEHLQNAVNQYGITAVSFSIIEECPRESLNDREKYWISELKAMNRDNGYNIMPGGSVDWTKPNNLGICGENSPGATITDDKALDIISRLKDAMPCVDIAKELNIPFRIIYSIKEHTAWRHITDGVDFPNIQTSEYYGVGYNKSTGKYRCRVNFNGKCLYSNRWNTEDEATITRDIFIREHDIKSNKVKLNFPLDMPLVMPRKPKTSSKYIGVFYNTSLDRWQASIQANGKYNYAGVYKTEEEAVIARDHWIDEHIVELNGVRLKRNDISQISAA